MGALQNFWLDPAIKIHNKYLIYCSIPVNLMWWGFEFWALHEAMMKKLNVLFHQGIRIILGIKTQQVIYEHITNESVCAQFNNIPCLRFQIAKRKLTFLVKIVIIHVSQIPTQLIIAWCDHPRQLSSPLQTKNKNLLRDIRLFVPSTARNDSILMWAYLAIDSSYWNHLVSQIGDQSTDWNGDMPHQDNPPTHPT